MCESEDDCVNVALIFDFMKHSLKRGAACSLLSIKFKSIQKAFLRVLKYSLTSGVNLGCTL